jgi:hypothetical protein
MPNIWLAESRSRASHAVDRHAKVFGLDVGDGQRAGGFVPLADVRQGVVAQVHGLAGQVAAHQRRKHLRQLFVGVGGRMRDQRLGGPCAAGAPGA